MVRLFLLAVALPLLLLANLCECKTKHESLEAAKNKYHEFIIQKSPRIIYLSRWTECNEELLPPGQHKDVSTTSDDDNWHNKAVRPVIGVQTRQFSCLNLTASVMDPSECGKAMENVIAERPCLLKLDCIVGEWAMWLDQPDGSRVRYREIVRMPQGGGADCGVVQEVQPAAMEPSAHWVPGPWGSCNVTLEQSTTKTQDPEDQIDDDIYEDDNAEASEYQDAKNSSVARCGGGIQARKVTCVRVDGKMLADAQCAHVSMPTLVQPCEVPCPRDCEIGEWTEWTPCQPTDGCPLFPVQQLTTTGYSVRHRRVKSAASGGGAPCPPLEEKRTCAAPKCASWKTLPWGPCVLNTPHTVCGPGKRTRELMCVGNDGKEGQRAWCLGSPAPARSEACRVACAGDCVVAAWGAWGACSHACSAPAAPPPRRLRTRHVLATAAPSGWPCPSEERLVQYETCNTHACATYSWLATPWGPCERRPEDFVPNSNYTDFLDGDTMSDFDEEEPCIEEGEMARDVMCVQNNADIVREALCAPLKRPVSRRACTVRCRRTPEVKGCKVEPWGAWSKCGNSCDRAQQSRKRVVHGGPNCGAITETRDCPMPNACKNIKPKWSYSEWKKCQMPQGSDCGHGVSVRHLECMMGPSRVELARCAGQVAPHLTKTCYEPCLPRHVSRKPTCEEACKNPFQFVSKSDPQVFTNCSCPAISLELSPADSDCILPPGAECGEGKSYRAAKCLFNREEVPIEVCLQFHKLEGPYRVSEAASDGLAYAHELNGLVYGSCSVRCARDCALGPWGEWGPCSHEANSLAAYRYRSREVIDEGTAGGRECGPTLQRSSCAVATPRWVVGEWSLCVPERGQCGSAIINRTVICSDGSGGRLPAASCAGSGATPAHETTCRAPCPRDCVLSPWSDWSPCQMTKWGGRRDRTRVVLRSAASGGGACGPLVEGEPCAATETSWHAAPWDDCTPLGDSPCGEGIKRRTVRCLRNDGVFLNDSFCPNTTNMEPRESWCYVPCGVDCALGEWSDWDSSACLCGDHAAHMRRTRQRLSAPVWPGRPCPVVEQRIPCPRTMCMKLVSKQPAYCGSEYSVKPFHLNYCGWVEKVTDVGCQPINNEGLPALANRNALLEPSFCTAGSPGRFTFALTSKAEYFCTRRCGCHENEIGTQGPWSHWGFCNYQKESRTRELITKPKASCNIPVELLTTEWSSCLALRTIITLINETKEHQPDQPDPRLFLDEDKNSEEYKQKVKLIEAESDETYIDDPDFKEFEDYADPLNDFSDNPRLSTTPTGPPKLSGEKVSGAVVVIVRTGFVILGLYGIFITYKVTLTIQRSRELKKIAKV